MYRFTYNGNVYTTPNLIKKLKRLHIAESDITDIEEISGKQEIDLPEIRDRYNANEDKVEFYFWEPAYNIYHCGFVRRDMFDQLTAIDVCRNSMWDPVKKVGVKDHTPDRIATWIKLAGEPKFPQVIGSDGLPELAKTY